jgi:hypothetical protein
MIDDNGRINILYWGVSKNTPERKLQKNKKGL